ncbi:DMT family transporter [Tabrizicola sp. J26]|uniref:DMT family transporter n=1 Tax=Alitabrizicola rongguiensis TaxID=2909234 RepID=UPI001F46E2F0|nr:DMT family transporter [Tabrizicola rongguiensis]MCF1709409.1 DMT family transporter [Tabrizicola rongguiensis]
MLLAMLVFSLNDVLGKWLVASYSVSLLMAMRGLAALTVLLVLLRPNAWGDRVNQLWQVEQPWLRAFVLVVEGMEFYAAVALLPLADVVTYWLAATIYVAALSPWLLGERVDGWAWGAILLGFAGVVVALQPSGQSLGTAAALPIAGSFAYALAMILSRRLRSTPDWVLVFWQIVGALIASMVGLTIMPGAWQTPGWRDGSLLCLLGVVAMAAHLLVNRAFKHAPAAHLMPFTYSLLVWALVFGALVFRDRPNAAILAGAGLIILAGLILATRRDRR